jgi:hypothetical protein
MIAERLDALQQLVVDGAVRERFSSLPIRSSISAVRSSIRYGTGVSTPKPVLRGSFFLASVRSLALPLYWP